MLRPRIIPCLLVQDKGLVKTVNFSNPKYIGDPINTARIFNEKQVDELMVLDISATTKHELPDYKMIENVAAECQMPLCYGGGIKTIDQARTIIGLGVEKIAISSAVIENPERVLGFSEAIGSQSVVVVLDVKRQTNESDFTIWTHNGSINTGQCPIKFVQVLQKYGVGEIVLNSIDNDGVMAGYDLDFAKKIREKTTTPMTILGGAGSLSDIGSLIEHLGTVGVGVGSLFVFKGIFKAVLINYPNFDERDKLIFSPDKNISQKCINLDTIDA